MSHFDFPLTFITNHITTKTKFAEFRSRDNQMIEIINRKKMSRSTRDLLLEIAREIRRTPTDLEPIITR